MSLRNNFDMKRPLAQGKGTTDMTRPLRIYKQPLMVLITTIDMALALICFGDNLFREVTGSQTNQSSSDLAPAPLSQQLHLAHSSFLQGNPLSNSVIWTSRYILAMPRIRGKPRRGAAWYAAASQRKRKRNLRQLWR
jgi:hypothetical protein